MSVSLMLEERFVRFSCVTPPFYPEQVLSRTVISVNRPFIIRYTSGYRAFFPVTCPVLVLSLLNFQATHTDRENFERQRRKILSPDNQILHILVRFPSGTYPFAGVAKPLAT